MTSQPTLNRHFAPTNYVCPVDSIFYRETIDGFEVVIDITTDGEGVAYWMHDSSLIGWADARTMIDWMDNVLPISTWLEIDPGIENER